MNTSRVYSVAVQVMHTLKQSISRRVVHTNNHLMNHLDRHLDPMILETDFGSNADFSIPKSLHKHIRI